VTARHNLALVAAVTGAGSLSAQSIGVGAARWLTTPHVSDYRVAVLRYRLGPAALVPFGQVAVVGGPADDAVLVGFGGDLVVRLSPLARPYLVAGASGGFIDLEKRLGVSLWSTWSGGLGAELLRVGPIGVAVEGRYQRMSRAGMDGVSLGVRIGSPLGSGARGALSRSAEPSPAGELRPADPRPALATAARAGRALLVVDLARQAMGAPYRWGGSDQNGFDCSGLIRYAYGELGIDLPRQSRDQARAGRAVERSVEQLAPGDILTFAAAPDGAVTHVGLYLGHGSFVHSASTGVRIDRLDPDDPNGKWWFSRWIGARRILD
jgi:hypothetical protein